MDKTEFAAVNKLKELSSHNDIHQIWIPFHVELFHNDIVDALTQVDAFEPLTYSGPHTYKKYLQR